MKELATLKGKSNSSLVINSPEDLVNSFFEFLDCTEQTARTYRYGISQFLQYLHSENISRPTRETILAYKKQMTERGLKPSTISLRLSSLRRFFTWCETERLYENITRGVKSPKMQGGHKRDYLNGAQIAAMLETVQSKRDYAMISLIATTGLRTVEVIRANVGDIHVIGGVTVLDIQGKGHVDKDAYVKLSQPVINALNDYLHSRGRVSPDEPLFVSESYRNRGQRLSRMTVSSTCKKAMKKAGYDSSRLTAHSLRHSAATLALMAGMQLQDVQQFMRHSSINTTLIYAHDVNRLNSLCEASVTTAIFGDRRCA